MRIIEHFDNGARLYPNNIAFVDVGSDEPGISFAEAQPRTHSIAFAIDALGCSNGGHVAVLAPNCSVAFLALLGLFRAECVWLPMNPRNTVPVNADLFSRFDGELLLFHSSYAEEAAQLKEQCPGLKKIICIDGDCEVGDALEQWCKDAPVHYTSKGAQPEDIFAIFPTGGTTGRSKGVVLTHNNINTFFNNFYAHFNYYDNSCHLVVAPMTHTAGLTGCLHFARGGTNAIMSSTNPADIADAMEKYSVTHLFLPPTVLYMMLALPDIDKRDYSKLQHFLVGAAPTS
jgi:acyl-CoA synthetase (AMP-forming)/AMP-acid ligase II